MLQMSEPSCPKGKFISSILDNCNIKFTLQREFEKLQSRDLDFRYPQKAIEKSRISFSGCLAEEIDFVHINPERVLAVLAMRYLHYCPSKSSRTLYWSKDEESGGFLSTLTDLPQFSSTVRTASNGSSFSSRTSSFISLLKPSTREAF